MCTPLMRIERDGRYSITCQKVKRLSDESQEAHGTYSMNPIPSLMKLKIRLLLSFNLILVSSRR